MATKFIDVSDYQESSLEFFQKMKAKGAEGVVIKLTEGSADGSNWKSQTAATKIKNASDAGLVLGFYHFATPALPMLRTKQTSSSTWPRHYKSAIIP